MEISVENLSPVDKEVTLKANRDDLSPKFNEAFKKYRKEIHMPGFRPGNVPVGLIKKRFGREIELEEINKYVQEVYEKEIVPEHEPIGETQMTDLTWEDDQLAVTFKIGAKPDFELADLKTITVDKMVHDVTDEEVQEEIDRTLERKGNWVETDAEITEKSQVTVDAETLDEDGNPIEGEQDEDQKIDLRQEGAADFRKHLVGKKKGDQETMEVGEGEEIDRFRISVKKVEVMEKAELTDAFAKENSNGEAKNVDEFKAYIKSKMQDYYDQSSGDLFQQDAVDALTEAHEFDVPTVMLEQI
ncbi:MAG: trigger factor, partial [Balneolaceae bacterium]